MSRVDPTRSTQSDLYGQASTEFGAALDRLVRAYEADPDKQRDLHQEIHMALWRSFETYESRCSLRTWVYRVAHNVAASYIFSQRRSRSNATLVSLEEIDAMPDLGNEERDADDRLALARLLRLIHDLKPPDRQLMLLYLEGMDAIAIGDIAGLSPANVRTKVRRIKEILARRFHGRQP
jgi:RNA polymerase sigma-70 factor, ECF subfamily